MNNNEVLRCQPEGIESQVSTKLVVCECGARLIDFGYDIHRQEYHSGTVGNERCHSEAEQRALEGRY